MSASAEDLLLHEMLKARHCTLLILSVLLRRDLQRKHQKPRPRQIPRPQGARRAHSRCSLRVPGRVHFHAQLTAEPPKKKTPLASCLLRSFGRNSAAPTVLATSTAKLCLRARSNAQRSPLRPRRAAEPSRAERQSGAQSSPSMRLQLDKAVNPMLATLSLDDTTPLRHYALPSARTASHVPKSSPVFMQRPQPYASHKHLRACLRVLLPLLHEQRYVGKLARSSCSHPT